jgi:hypothetical protein
MSIEYVLVAAACATGAQATLPEQESWVDVGDNYKQYQGAPEEFLVSVGPMDSGYNPPPEIVHAVGTSYQATVVSQEGGYSSTRAESFLLSVFEAVAGHCEVVWVDSPAGVFSLTE